MAVYTIFCLYFILCFYLKMTPLKNNVFIQYEPTNNNNSQDCARLLNFIENATTQNIWFSFSDKNFSGDQWDTSWNVPRNDNFYIQFSFCLWKYIMGVQTSWINMRWHFPIIFQIGFSTVLTYKKFLFWSMSSLMLSSYFL